jgi:tetratricopeptide (TPR) repeat protein
MISGLRTFTLFLVLAAALPAMAANEIERADAKLRYDECLGQASRNPGAALAMANAWIAQQGGAPAEHCAAVALTGLKRYPEAAAKLDALGRAPDVGALRPSLLDQAGNAWLLAGDANRAIVSFQGALALAANDADFYADLARAQALKKDWPGAISDLNAALAITPWRGDLLVLRAAARHAQGDLNAARVDVNKALAIKADDPEGLLERGSIARDAGDLAAARGDLEKVVKLGAGSPTGERAWQLLTAMDEAAKAKLNAKPIPAKPKPTPPAH